MIGPLLQRRRPNGPHLKHDFKLKAHTSLDLSALLKPLPPSLPPPT